MSKDQNQATHEKDLAIHRSKNCLKLECTSLCTRNYFENLSGFETYTWILGLGIRNVQSPLGYNWNTSKYGTHTTKHNHLCMYLFKALEVVVKNWI
jgi:hypothetical protein